MSGKGKEARVNLRKEVEKISFWCQQGPSSRQASSPTHSNLGGRSGYRGVQKGVEGNWVQGEKIKPFVFKKGTCRTGSKSGEQGSQGARKIRGRKGQLHRRRIGNLSYFLWAWNPNKKNTADQEKGGDSSGSGYRSRRKRSAQLRGKG